MYILYSMEVIQSYCQVLQMKLNTVHQLTRPRLLLFTVNATQWTLSKEAHWRPSHLADSLRVSQCHAEVSSNSCE